MQLLFLAAWYNSSFQVSSVSVGTSYYQISELHSKEFLGHRLRNTYVYSWSHHWWVGKENQQVFESKIFRFSHIIHAGYRTFCSLDTGKGLVNPRIIRLSNDILDKNPSKIIIIVKAEINPAALLASSQSTKKPTSLSQECEYIICQDTKDHVQIIGFD